MTALSAVLRGSFDEPAHFCPGCQEMHVLPWKRGGWTFDGNVVAPSFHPSFLHRWKAGDVDKACHYILTAGVLHFQIDCTHALAGKSVPMALLPVSA